MEQSFTPFLWIILLIIASAFFSGSETGLTAVSKAKIHKMKMNGNKRAETVSNLRQNKDRLIAALLLGNNVVNILASAIATSLAIKMFGDNGVFYATIAMTAALLIFGEVMPKTYAFQNAEKVAMLVAPVLKILIKILAPITDAVQIAVNGFMRAIGASKKGVEMSFADELRGAIDLNHQEGRVIKREKDMLRSILDLSDTEVGEVMVHRKHMTSIDINMPTKDFIAEVLNSNHTRIPIWKDTQDNIIGTLHVKDLLSALRSHKSNVESLDINSIINKPWFVPETTTLNNQLFQFRRKRSHMALVVNEYGDIIGLITLEDILEEIVGHIYDEHDTSTVGIKKLKTGGVSVKGNVTIRDLNRAMEWNLPDEEAATVAGLIVHESESIPETGEEFTFHGYFFKIEKKKNNQITRVVVKKLKK